MDLTTRGFYEDSSHVKELSPSDFQNQSWTLKNYPNRQVTILFYAPWCPHCQRFKGTWESLYRINSCLQLLAFNCAKYAEYVSSVAKVSEAVRSYPTIMFYSDNSPKETYQGQRDPPDDLVKAMLLFCQRVSSKDGV